MTPIPIREAETAPAGISAFQLTNENGPKPFSISFLLGPDSISGEDSEERRISFDNNSLEE